MRTAEIAPLVRISDQGASVLAVQGRRPKAELASDAGADHEDLPSSAEPLAADHVPGEGESSSIQGTAPLAIQMRAREEEVAI
jgi:hypothetical protein